MPTFQDGVITDKEFSDQKAHLIELMKEDESILDDEFIPKSRGFGVNLPRTTSCSSAVRCRRLSPQCSADSPGAVTWGRFATCHYPACVFS